jgi:hypothetical protein
MLLGLIYSLVLGLDRLATASLLLASDLSNTGRGCPVTLIHKRCAGFLLQAPPGFRQQLHRFHDRLLRQFIQRPEHRSCLLLDLVSTVLTDFGRQEGVAVGDNPSCWCAVVDAIRNAEVLTVTAKSGHYAN